jgi:hypothetical protein
MPPIFRHMHAERAYGRKIPAGAYDDVHLPRSARLEPDLHAWILGAAPEHVAKRWLRGHVPETRAREGQISSPTRT